jgi:DNA-binding protein HU-beta
MTKADIVDRIAEGTGLTKIETKAVVDGFMTVVAQALEDGERIELRGFGSFTVQQRAPRMARNPQTNEPIRVGERYVPVFSVSQQLQEAVDASMKARPESDKRPSSDAS